MTRPLFEIGGYKVSSGHIALFAFAAVALTVAGMYAEKEGYIDFVPESVDEDIPTTVTIDDEGYRMGWKLRPGYHWFEVTIEGEKERFTVPRDIADLYKPGSKIEVTFDRNHWRDGSTSVSGVKLK